MKLSQLFFSFFLAFFLLGCQANNSDEPISNGGGGTPVVVDGSVNLVILSSSSQTLTNNSQQVSITIQVLASDNSSYTEGNVKIKFPAKRSQPGMDLGSFAAESVAVGSDGRAVFSYTGPANLQDRVNQNDTSTTFTFYHDSDPDNSPKDFTVTYSPVPNQITLTNYLLKESASSDQYTMALESSRQMSFFVEDDKGNKLDDSDIQSINVELLNPQLADIRDTNGRTGDELLFTNQNSVSVEVKSFTRSGIVPIEVNATFTDANDETQNLLKVFNITILSGPPTAMSIGYEGTNHENEVRAKFSDVMVVTITDKYFNAVNTEPAASAYLITGYTLENALNLDTRLAIETSSAKAATVNPTANTVTTTANLTNVDLHNDILITYGNGYTYNVSGKWDMDSINGGEISLGEDVVAKANTSNIGFAIGNNFRQETCVDAQESVGYIELDSDRFDSAGTIRATINYDYYLTGKKVVVGVDTIGYTADGDITSKFGEGHYHTLRGMGLSPQNGCTFGPGVTGDCTITIAMDETGETYKNAKFTYTVTAGDKLVINGITDWTNYNIHNCTTFSDGTSFVTINATNTDATSASTLNIADVKVVSEF